MSSIEHQILKWDSEFYGFTVASMDLKAIGKNAFAEKLEELSAQRVALCYCRTSPDNIETNRILQQAQARLVDQKVTFSKEIERTMGGGGRLTTSYLHSEINDKILSLAIQSGEFSRFRTDVNLPSGSFEMMYEAWIRNSLSGALARDVLCYLMSGVEVGLVTISVNEKCATIGLIAVDQGLRGKKIGSILLKDAVSRCADWKVSELLVATQATNIVATEFYKKNGFSIKAMENIYHLWL